MKAADFKMSYQVCEHLGTFTDDKGIVRHIAGRQLLGVEFATRKDAQSSMKDFFDGQDTNHVIVCRVGELFPRARW